jgi:tetratricopeptide (TPR) repeat protein
LLLKAGYDPAEAPKLFVILQKEAAAEKKKELFFFGSHPKLQARIDNYEGLLKNEYADTRGGITNTDEFLKIIGPLLLDNAEMDVKAGRNESARESIRHYLAARGDSARAYFLLGETFRHSGTKADVSKSLEYYLKSATVDLTYPDPHRVLGLLAYKRNDRDQARKSLERYLELSPKAPDRGYVEEMLKSLR